MATFKAIWQWLICCFVLVKSRSIFRPALIIIDQERYAWNAGVDYDPVSKLYVGYIISNSSYKLSISHEKDIRLQKMQWYREYDVVRRGSAWKTILG